MVMLLRSLLVTLALAEVVVRAAPPLYMTPGAPIEARVSDLLGRMTMLEKVNQVSISFSLSRARALAGLGSPCPSPCLTQLCLGTSRCLATERRAR